MSGQSSKSEVKFFRGQKDIGEALFAPGGPFESLLRGAADPAFEAGVDRSRQALAEDQAKRGLVDSPLGFKGAVDLEAQASTGREQNRLQTLVQGVQPIGTTSKGGGGGICAVADVLFGIGSPSANRARAYAMTHDNWFIRLYRKHVWTWAAWAIKHPYLKWVVSPPWLYMAWRGY